MAKKQYSYSSIREWAEKRSSKGTGIGGVGAALASYEAVKAEIKELGAKLEEKRKARSEMLSSLVGEFKKVKDAARKAAEAERKAAKKAKKAEKSGAASS